MMLFVAVFQCIYAVIDRLRRDFDGVGGVQ